MPLLVSLSTRFTTFQRIIKNSSQISQSQIQNEKVAPLSPGIELVKCSTSTHPFIHRRNCR